MDDEPDYLDWRQGCYICESHIRPASDQWPGQCWCALLEPCGERGAEEIPYEPPWKDKQEFTTLVALKLKVLRGEVTDVCPRGHAGCTTCEVPS